MAYNANALVRLAALKALAAKTKAEIDNINTDVSKTIKSLGVSGNTVSFYTSADKSGTAAFTFDFPKEMFLDQAKTIFVQKFAFSTETYPGATDPKLAGKPVMVLAVKGQNPDSCSYSFLDMSALVDTYKAKATGKDASTTVTIAGYEVDVKVNISAAAGNALVLKDDGLYVDISGKADKVIELVKENGKTYAVVNDFGKLRDLFGQMLREVQRIKSEGDYEAGKALVEQYAVTVDPELHKEVRDRYYALDIEPYGGFVNPEYELVEKDGRIVDVKISYPADYVGQMLGYAKDYSFLPNIN